MNLLSYVFMHFYHKHNVHTRAPLLSLFLPTSSLLFSIEGLEGNP
jgi:hypothetical protein